MPRVTFTPHLQRFVDAPPREVPGDSVRSALESVFVENPRLRDYILDERGAVRQHVTIFVGDSPIRDRIRLTDAVSADEEIFVLQALSGGHDQTPPRRTEP
jgi:hypothetical protein